MRNPRPKHLKGFSLLEVLLSVAVLTIGILPVLLSATKAFNASLRSRDTVAASELAQEGIELLKNVKDNNVLAGNRSLTAWLPTSSAPWSASNCRIDVTSSALSTPATKISCGQSSFDLAESGGHYIHTGTSGRFKRRIYLSYSSGTQQEQVTCVSAVYWGSYSNTANAADIRANCRAGNGCVYAESTLTPWGP
ncbi:MAG: prepilin-type N-terminal cleavage/methylation domain-containing protein [Candidatus Moranbacteria bacterium]|nr:prepilin-type N-terminal cleavage/methylation domain-containing protein [Candidatus Moranbacteria bacterium]